MNVHFLSPWCRTSLLFNFLSVLVVQGGAECLPTPPSWFVKNQQTTNFGMDIEERGPSCIVGAVCSFLKKIKNGSAL